MLVTLHCGLQLVLSQPNILGDLVQLNMLLTNTITLNPPKHLQGMTNNVGDTTLRFTTSIEPTKYTW